MSNPTDSLLQCDNHPGEYTDYFCKVHFSMCCKKCTENGGAHCNCGVVPFSDVDMDDLKKCFSNILDDVEKLHRSAEQNIRTELEKKCTKITDNTLEAKQSITNYFDELRKVINERENILMKLIEDVSNSCNISNTLYGLDVIDKARATCEFVRSAHDKLNDKLIACYASKTYRVGVQLKAAMANALDIILEDPQIVLSKLDPINSVINSIGEVKLKKRPPISITEREATPSSIKISWEPKGPGFSYQVATKAIDKKDFSISDEAIQTSEYIAKDLLHDTQYAFTVRPCAHCAYGNWCRIMTAKTQKLPGPCNLCAEPVSETRINLCWNSAPGAKMYRIAIKPAEGAQQPAYYSSSTPCFSIEGLTRGASYLFSVMSEYEGGRSSKWSSCISKNTLIWTNSVWSTWKSRRCKSCQYSVDKKSSKIAKKAALKNESAVTGNTFLPYNATLSWEVQVVSSKGSDGKDIYIGVAPFDINQTTCKDYESYGWYICCYNMLLYSGPPQNFKGIKYGLCNEAWGAFVHTGDSVGVVMDTTKGELSFVVNGVNLGVAFNGIPLDKPLVPCVLLKHNGSFIELDTSEVKENVNRSIAPPTNIEPKSITWDTTAFSWNAVEGASFYQIKSSIDGFWKPSLESTVTYTRLKPDTEYSFRVRAVYDNWAGVWSDTFIIKTQVQPWADCPKSVYVDRKYAINKEDISIAKKIENSNDYCTIIGSTLIPLNYEALWNIKILNSKNNDGSGICIGIAPSGINQNFGDNTENGWYLDCNLSVLRSGPPHDCLGKEYGPRKGKGQYVHTGDIIGVVMNTAKGELSFILNGVNWGVAYEGIPLDKPLVICVLLKNLYDSVKMEVAGPEDTEYNELSNISSIYMASTPYKIVKTSDEDSEAENQIKQEPCTDEEEYKDNRTDKEKKEKKKERKATNKRKAVSKATEASSIAWKPCPSYVDWNRQYSVPSENRNIARKINFDDDCTIILNTALIPCTVTHWGIKIRKSRDKNSRSICVGVAPLDIDQNVSCNYNKCGWYYDCFSSSLFSGPPQNINGKAYGPKRSDGKYVKEEDIVGVLMDTINGELSFIVNGVNPGIAFKEIPLDEPLVPCAIIIYKEDAVEYVDDYTHF